MSTLTFWAFFFWTAFCWLFCANAVLNNFDKACLLCNVHSTKLTDYLPVLAITCCRTIDGTIMLLHRGTNSNLPGRRFPVGPAGSACFASSSWRAPAPDWNARRRLGKVYHVVMWRHPAGGGAKRTRFRF